MSEDEKPKKKLYHAKISFEIYVWGNDEDDVKEEIMQAKTSKLYAKMRYLPASIVVNPIPCNILKEET